MTLIEEKNLAIVNQEEVLSTETDDLESLHSKLRPILTKALIVWKVSRIVRIALQNAFAQSWEVVSDASVHHNSPNETLELRKEDMCHLLQSSSSPPSAVVGSEELD